MRFIESSLKMSYAAPVLYRLRYGNVHVYKSRAGRAARSRTCECIPIPALQTSLMLIVSCPTTG
ncbi:hypothetical protein, partial [uncultured Bradyrhizobium sp.]|uniref:hypothetical protein n=1 Tax=uncultured Bradyrhizobium sp. TaxID=199684 RepID=UPI0035CC2B2E